MAFAIAVAPRECVCLRPWERVRACMQAAQEALTRARIEALLERVRDVASAYDKLVSILCAILMLDFGRCWPISDLVGDCQMIIRTMRTIVRYRGTWRLTQPSDRRLKICFSECSGER